MRDDEQTKADWGRLFELLDTALELEPAARESWLQGLDDIPDSLKERLRQLLSDRSRLRKKGFLEKPAIRAALTPEPATQAEEPRTLLRNTLQPQGTGPSSAGRGAATLEPEIPTDVRGIGMLPTCDDPNAPRVGMIIKGRYTLTEELGEGGMGRVFKARDQRRVEAEDRRPYVALKVLSEDFKQHPDAFIALQREGKRAQELAHPNIITVHDFDRDGPLIFMTMEYLQGKGLDAHLNTDFAGGVSVAAAWPIIRGIGAALEYGHSKKIVHCDMKPSNVFICRDGAVKVLDFGIARPMLGHDPEGEVTRFDPGKRLGGLTPAYASLEMWARDTPDPRDDIYAFACVMYQLLAGEHPFGTKSARTVRDEKLTPKRIDSINRAQWEALRKGLALHREARIATVAQLIAPFAPSSFVRRHVLSMSGAAAVVAVAGLALGAHFYRLYVEDELIGEPSDPPVTHPNVNLTPEQKQDVTEKLTLAHEFFEGVTLAESPDEMLSSLSEGANNVSQILQDVLTTDPGNPAALQLQSKVADLYARKARQLADAGDVKSASQLVNAGLRLRPQHRELFRLRGELCKANPAAC